jgi:magnesium transporter
MLLTDDPSVPVPSLPRIKRQRPRAATETVGPREPRLAELTAQGLTWVHLETPTPEEAAQLAERFGWHPLDVEDVLSKRQRPKVDEYSEYLFTVLHFPAYDKAIQRLNAAELDLFLGPDFLITLPAVAPTGDPALRALPGGRGAAPCSSRRLRLPALPRA